MRTEAYRRAIAKRAPGCLCLDIGTGAEALLALMAAEAGAAHVYAVEAHPRTAELARRAVAAHGFGERVTVIQGYSTEVVLPQAVDLIIHEIIGEVAGMEGVVVAIVDARVRHLRPKAAVPFSVPARARTRLAPAEWPNLDYFASLRPPVLALGSARSVKLFGFPPASLLAPTQVCEDLRFESLQPTAWQHFELRFSIRRNGTLWALAMHVELFVYDGEAVEPEVSAAKSGSHWPWLLLPLPESQALSAGDVLLIRSQAHLAGAQPFYEFEVLLEGKRDAGGARSRSVTHLSTLRYPSE